MVFSAIHNKGSQAKKTNQVYEDGGQAVAKNKPDKILNAIGNIFFKTLFLCNQSW